MKRFAPWFCVVLLGMTACHAPYDIVLRNGAKITAVGRPVFDKANSVYHYKDAKGQDHVISELRVREIDARSIFSKGD